MTESKPYYLLDLNSDELRIEVLENEECWASRVIDQALVQEEFEMNLKSAEYPEKR